MDDIVRQAMSKWPNVPACVGWLGLDSRGQWYMRDDRTQALGAFQSGVPGAKGSVLRHEKLIDFIQRNYEADAQGRWYFQNGPQRVFVELEATPWVWRLDADHVPVAQSGQRTQVLACLMDEQGRVYLDTPLGLGLVHTLDVGLAAEALDAGLWSLQECEARVLPERYGFVPSPQAQGAVA
jgi:Protein of unknown function (DUF2946)